ncbi:myb-related protein MYBAS2-like [Miscanthus floridulus]|uniref:myb-related protein MYBAS2-like n=1 Tax=Miscanthus floridulus TaxID=154761 RepID=UPI0034595E30
MVTVREEMRKGPWTEQEDMQLVCTVRLLGGRRWDSIAQVSGLNRTGKSYRMRWVNYLHPGLKQGRLSTQEERLVIELRAHWGNSWSRIARRLPGRTDNDIKNYWKTRMRTKAQEREMNTSPSSSSFSLT